MVLCSTIPCFAAPSLRFNSAFSLAECPDHVDAAHRQWPSWPHLGNRPGAGLSEPSQTNVAASKNLIARERKDDLKRLKCLGIISSCERLYSNGCLLLSSANDGEGRCVL